MDRFPGFGSDEYSSLNGVELAMRKLKLILVTAGNFGLESFRGEKVFFGYLLFINILFGGLMSSQAVPRNFRFRLMEGGVFRVLERFRRASQKNDRDSF